MGFEPHQPLSRFEAVNEFTDRMKDTLEEAKSALAKAKDDGTVLQPPPLLRTILLSWRHGLP